jgi:hypothetical protein
MITKALPRQIQPTFSSCIYKIKGWDARVRFPVRIRDISLLQNVPL